jgi:hypothetical protein
MAMRLCALGFGAGLLLLFGTASSGESGKVARLYRITVAEVAGIRISDAAAGEIQSFLSAGAEKSGATESDLESGARKFGQALAEKARFDESAGEKRIDVAVVRAARSSVCPLYPFC